MSTNKSFKDLMRVHLIRTLGSAILLFAASITASAAITDLATKPITQSGEFRAKPNILFVLDDSGSMSEDSLPDWATPANPVNAAHLKYNADFNGIAYNPAIRYYPPVMYTSTGAPDSTTYLSQTGESIATGGNASATTASRNWRAVKNDAYGVQALPTAVTNLETSAFYYTTIVGEYCDSAQLRNCTASATPTGAYTFPAKLRWCTTLAKSLGTTTVSNTGCQAVYVEVGTTYNYPRIARTSTIFISRSSGTVNSIKIGAGGPEILSAPASIAADPNPSPTPESQLQYLANDIVNKINACTFAKVGNCTAATGVGYTAASSGYLGTDPSTSDPISTISLTSQTPSNVKTVPVIAGIPGITASAFSGDVPGYYKKTVINAALTPKPDNRTDCILSTTSCTYNEEMTNYANWWTYYHTRMQMMKTASSIAFAPVTNGYRVGYYSINNGTGSDFLNLGDFEGSQKYAWYTKFFSANPKDLTPLRGTLANAGKLYAGKVTTLNNVAATDPMQYSCQQNYTILSTDGYWNDQANPTQLDGKDIDQQDGDENRPYFDGTTQTRTVSQTTEAKTHDEQSTSQTQSRTQQQQKTTRLLTQKDIKTTYYPWQVTQSKLQKSTTLLTSNTYPLNETIIQPQKTTTTLQSNTYKITATEQLLQKKTQKLTENTWALQSTTTNVTKKTFKMKSSTYNLISTPTQLQKMSDVSNNLGDTYTTSAWTNTTSCTPTGAAWVFVSGTTVVRNTKCQYAPTASTPTGSLTTCTSIAQSPQGANMKGPAISCTYETSAASSATGLNKCDGNVSTGPSYIPKVVCSYETTSTSATGLSTCTVDTQSPTFAAPQITCEYGSASAATAVTSCSVIAASGNANDGSVWNSKIACAYVATAKTDQSSCTWGTSRSAQGANMKGPAVECAYQTAANNGVPADTCTATAKGTATTSGSKWSSSDTCTYVAGDVDTDLSACTPVANSASPNYVKARTCAYQGTPVFADNLSTCTVVNALANKSAERVDCLYGNPVTVNIPAGGTCTPVAASSGGNGTKWTVKNPVTCNLGNTVVNNDVPTCTPKSASSTQLATSCAYGIAVPDLDEPSCTVKPKSAQGPNMQGSAKDCAYGGAGAFTNVATGNTCVTQSQTPTGTAPAYTYTGPAVACKYTAQTPTNAATCTKSDPDSGSPYSKLTAIACTAGAYNDPPVTTTTPNKSACTAGSFPAAVPSTGIQTITTCTYQGAVTADASSCTVVPTSTSPNYVADVTCSVLDSHIVAVKPTGVPAVAVCTPTGTPPATFGGAGGTFDANGTVTECQTLVSGPTPVPAATCSNSIGSSPDWISSSCTTEVDQVPVPINPAVCTPSAGVSPDYINTTCTVSKSLPTTAMGCLTQSPIAPLWQTVTCVDDGNGTINTLADTAEYYYKTDLRTNALGNCTGSPVTVGGIGNPLCTDELGKFNNVPVNGEDKNQAQHMTTFTLGLGASGLMQYRAKYLSGDSDDYNAVKGKSPFTAVDSITANPSAGICSWQTGGPCNWPAPVSFEQTTIDDLWHAGVNGRGAYFSATDPASLTTSISTALASINAGGGAAAAPAVSNPNLMAGDNFLFSTTFATNSWTGELIRRQLNTVSGSVGSTTDWAAQDKLDKKPINSRNIYAYDLSAGNHLKAFTAANFGGNANFTASNAKISDTIAGLTQFLCSSPTVCIPLANQPSALGNNLVNYLRGDRTNEGIATDNTKYFRERLHILGDIVNASTVYVSKPRLKYSDAGYSDFIAAQTARRPMVYAGANDGMLHAFSATGSAAAEAAVAAFAADPLNIDKETAAKAAVDLDVTLGQDGGQELWAYIPSMVLPNMYKLADKDYANKHRYFVDSTPVVSDICSQDCDSSFAVWKTILVGGLGRGGRGYYALDITDPANPKALWEFTTADDANLGYSYGVPRITKLNDGKWVVLLTSGYNNVPNEDGAGGDGKGHLYVLKAATGERVITPSITATTTDGGSTTSPSGLAQIALNVINPTSDNTAQAAYAGDLNGNLWRFDINDNIGASGNDAQLLASLKDGDGNAQPITTKPEVGVIEGFPVLFVGTGKILGESDATDTSVQSIYAIKDPILAPAGNPEVAIYSNPGSPRDADISDQSFVRQVLDFEDCPANSELLGLCSKDEKVLTATNNAVDFSPTKNNGWYVDLISSGERANTNPALALGVLAVNTNIPSSIACSVGGQSYAYFFNYLTGGPIYSPGNGDSTLNNGVLGVKIADALSSSPTLVMTDSGKLISITVTSDNVFHSNEPPLPPGASVTRRTSWRELIRE